MWGNLPDPFGRNLQALVKQPELSILETVDFVLVDCILVNTPCGYF